MASGLRSPLLLFGIAAVATLPPATVGFHGPLFLLGITAPSTTPPEPDPTPTPGAGGNWHDFARDLERNDKAKLHTQATREDAEFLEVLAIITPIIARECR